MKKRIVIIITAMFFVAMLAITIWSRTLYQNRLTKVELVIPHTGTMNFNYLKYGTAQNFEDPDGVYTHTTQVYFNAGEHPGAFLWWRDEKVFVTFPAMADGSMEMTGYVTDVQATEEGYAVTVGFSRADIREGDSVAVNFRKTTGALQTLVPVAAVYDMFNADEAAYIYTVSETQGPWGNEYVVRKEFVLAGITDGESVYLPGYICRQPIILSAEAPVYEGVKVRFYP